jgi:hypothetical protein
MRHSNAVHSIEASHQKKRLGLAPFILISKLIALEATERPLVSRDLKTKKIQL